MRNATLDVRGRFMAHTIPEPNTGCLLWTATADSSGYGRFGVGSRTRGDRRLESAHRMAWILEHGPIPSAMRVLHRCDTPPCVNVDHLFLGTQKDNVHDMFAKGRHPVAARERAKRLCRRGHEFTAENTIVESGRRRCRECRNAQQRRRWSIKQGGHLRGVIDGVAICEVL